MKNILLVIIFILCSKVSFSQEWNSYNFTFKISDIENKIELNNVSFKYIDGERTNVNPIIFDIKKKEFSISYISMGGSPILVLEKENETMYILLKRKPFNPEKVKNGNEQNVILSKFMKGYFKPDNNELIEWNTREKYTEWIKQSDLKSLKMEYRNGN